MYAWRAVLNNTLVRILRKKDNKAVKLLGYSSLELKNHIENQFTNGMSWDNYGEWHVDHIVGIINFPKNTPINVVNSLSNLRPLWATTRMINGIMYEGNLNRKKIHLT